MQMDVIASVCCQGITDPIDPKTVPRYPAGNTTYRATYIIRIIHILLQRIVTQHNIPPVRAGYAPS